ncbi:hypothetical protein BCF55_0395 [Hydrogenivirga caldilitoris]|uniref:Tetratricopeptide repeat protein n=1 Tax=Hydrogenivirga caldilitoris TaxID=246264 RepID=A0A497XPD8_9AQUI|nr:hypothetical protein [Hydrogenivirga caldilitoris]RLJ70131.1 hypothetical protein BCF55_0395 [Hydrogenivirga caldilitoris]
MSLIIDVLKKFKGGERKTSVYPLLTKSKRERNPLNRKALFLLVPITLISFVAAYFITQLFIGEPVPPIPEVKRTAMQVSEVSKPPVPESPQLPQGQPIKQEQEHDRKEEIVREPVRSNLEEKVQVEKLTEDINQKEKTPPLKRSTEVDFNTLLYAADRYFKEGDLRRSADLYEKALGMRVTDGLVNNLLVVYARLGEYEKAEELLMRYPKERFAYSYLMELAQGGHLKKVLKSSEKFLYLDKGGYIHFVRSYAYEGLGDMGNALEEMGKAYEKNPRNPYFAYNYARLLETFRKYKEAYNIYVNLNTEQLDPNLRSIVKERLKYIEYYGLVR